MSQKSTGTTFLLNFLIPGTGHLYASGGERWGYFATNLTCAVLGTVLIFPWLGNIIVWLIAMIDSDNVTTHYNQQEAALGDSREAEQERRRAQERTTELKRQREERDERDHVASARAQSGTCQQE